IYKTTRLLTAMLLASAGLVAQPLAGSYTINSSQGNGGGNYNSFNAFATAVNALGVSGPVNVLVIPNSGYNEQVTFNAITGASSVNKITINGNNSTIFFSSSNTSQAWTILLNGADYFTFNNLNIQGTG